MSVRSRTDRMVGLVRARWWPIASVFAVLSLIVVLRDEPGAIVADNRFEVIAAPGQRWARTFGLWDSSRGLGDVREDVWPLTTTVSWALRSLGLPIWLVIRLWHAICLTIAATGTVALLRYFRPTIGVEHLACGLLVAFGPFSLTFLVPSNLSLMIALGPWLLVFVARGIAAPDGWAWAAWFALAVGSAGNPDLPGLLYSAVLFVPLVAYVVAVERQATWLRAATWFAQAAALTLLVSALTLTKTFLAGRRLSSRLAETESAAVSALTSSWSESVRGLGNWLSYFRTGGVLAKPQGVPYFDSWVVVAGTFAAPTIALIVLWRSNWRPAVLFASMMTVSLVLMVGGFRAPDSPIADAIGAVLTSNSGLGAFRNTYKAAAGLVVGGSILAGVGFAGVRAAARRRGTYATSAVDVAGAAILLAVSVPAWNGDLYHPSQRADAIPSYWYEATDYLDRLDDHGRVLVLPAASQVPYRWGTVGDDILDGLLQRPHAVATGVALSAPLGADAIEALTIAAQQSAVEPDVVADLARRLGITEIVLRNDVDWRTADVVRPARFDRLRSAPDFELVVSFGEAGRNVVAFGDDSEAAAREAELPPVEVYRIREAAAVGRVVAASAPVVVSGDARAWPTLVSSGLVPAGVPVLASGAASTRQLLAAFERGAEIVVTDTPRRRVRSLVAFEPRLSQTLSAAQDLDRPARPLYPAPGSEAVVWIADAAEITGNVSREVGATAHRPTMAFDADTDTAWSIPRQLAAGARIRVTFREPQRIDEVEVQALTRDGVSTVRSAWVSLSDGTVELISFESDGGAVIDLDGRTSDSLTIALRALDLAAGRVGLAEVALGDLDLREFVQTPDDLRQRGALDDVLAGVPTSYAFTRVSNPTWFEEASSVVPIVEERSIDRRFRTTSERTYEVVAAGSVTRSTDRAVVEALVDSALGGGCVDLGTKVGPEGGAPTEIRFRSRGQIAAIRSGEPFELTGCDDVTLGADWQVLQGGGAGVLDRVVFFDADRSVATSPARSAAVEVRSATSASARIEAPDAGSIVMLATAFDPEWAMVTPDGDRVRSMPVDGVNGWYLPAGVDGSIRFERGGERWVRIAAVVSATGVLLCALLVLRRRLAVRRALTGLLVANGEADPGSAGPAAGGDDITDPIELTGLDAEVNAVFAWFDSVAVGATDDRPESDPVSDEPVESTREHEARVDAPAPRAPLVVAASVGTIIAVGLVGLLGLAVGALIAVTVFGPAPIRRSASGWIGGIPVVLLVLAAVATIIEAPLSSNGPSLRFAADRRWAHDFTVMAFAFVAVSLSLRWVDTARRRGDGQDRAEQPEELERPDQTAAAE